VENESVQMGTGIFNTYIKLDAEQEVDEPDTAQEVDIEAPAPVNTTHRRRSSIMSLRGSYFGDDACSFLVVPTKMIGHSY